MRAITSLLLFFGYTSAHLRNHRKLRRAQDDSQKIHDEYIFVFADSVKDVDAKVHSLVDSMPGCSVLFIYREDFKGFSATSLPELQMWKTLDDPEVLFIEENQKMMATAQQSDATWGLDRLDETTLPLDGNYEYEYTGTGVKAFIIDTGIRLSHSDFGGRATCGFSAFSDNCVDEQGHGTHVAGTVGSATYGVAKDVELIAVKVLSSTGAGTTAGVIAGVDYVEQQKKNNATAPMVANMSLGGFPSQALNSAVNNAVNAGVTFVVAGGNSNIPACWISPSSSEKAITVGSTDKLDDESPFSNWGRCIDILAPGEEITSTWADSDSSTLALSGTSMAAPHVAGAAALHLEHDPNLSPSEVWQAIEAGAVQGAISGLRWGTPNLLVNTQDIDGDGIVVGGDDDDEEEEAEGGGENRERCLNYFNWCGRDSECCSNACTFGICFFF